MERERREAIRIEALVYYGGTCVCCGEANTAFLVFDHIHGDGAKQRRSVFGYNTGGWRFALWLKQRGYPKGIIQVLCYNCNCARHFSGNRRCPHELEV